MPGEAGQVKGPVASFVDGVVRSFLGRTPETKHREILNAVVESPELASPLNVLNEEALRVGPGWPTRTPRLKTKRTDLGENRPQKRNSAQTTTKEAQKQVGISKEKARSDVPTPTRTSPRGNKHLREVEDEEVAASKRSKKGSQSSRADSANAVGRTSQYPQVQIPGRQLRRPNITYKATRFGTKQQGEGVYDLDAGPSPEKRRTIPPVARTPEKDRGKNRKGTRKGGAQVPLVASKEPTDKNSRDDVMPRRRGGLKRLPEGGLDQRPQHGSSTHLVEEENQESGPSTEVDSGASQTPNVSQENASETRTTPRAADLDEDSVNDADAKESGSWKASDVALLGSHDAWNVIVEAARENRIDEDANGYTLAEHRTETVKSLSRTIQEASKQYRSLLTGKHDERAEQEIDDGLAKLMDEIESKMQDTREFDVNDEGEKIARKKGRKTIKDLYRRGVPDMVDLLNTAIICRSANPPDVYGFKEIMEVVRLMDLTLYLCDKTAKWKAKPLYSSKPIIKNIKSIVFPVLRGRISTVFHEELNRLSLVERRRENREKTQARRRESSQREQMEVQQSEAETTVDQWQLLEEEINRNLEESRTRQFGLSRPLYSSTGDRRLTSSQRTISSQQVQIYDDTWTTDQELELLEQLQERGSRNLPAEERYLKIRTANALHDKLPEDIQRKALELKPFLLEVLRRNGLPNVDYANNII